MKKHIFLVLLFSIAVNFTHAQCFTDSIPNAYNNGGQCYIDNFTVDANTITLSSGYTASGPSYQSFPSPYVMLRQDVQHWLNIGVVNSSSYTYAIWIDYNNDSVYSSTELVLYNPSYSNSSIFEPVTVPSWVLPDTVRMRVTIQQFATSWGPGADDACAAPGIGETEDYMVIIECANPQPLSFDALPVLCHADSLQLIAYSPNTVAWYTGSPMTLQEIGQNYFLHLAPNTTDTTVYLEFASPGCFSGWIDSMVITVQPTPVANIIGPDTIQSCSAVTISATPGPYDFSWNTGDTGSTINVIAGFGGQLSLSVTAPNGCSAHDVAWVHIAPDPPATYANVYPGSWYCQNLELYLTYDSLVAPGNCTWYTYPGNTLLGTGSQIIYTLPDTGVYQFMAVVNSVCGTDTVIRTVNGYYGSDYDSVYVLNATQDINGTYVICYNGNGSIVAVAAGVGGTVTEWILTDTTVGFTVSWNDDDTLMLPQNMAVVGHYYTAQAVILSPQGCPDTTAAIALTPANTINFNLSDTTWTCSFPVWVGQSSPNYAIYDILWSTGDTTIPINIPAMGTYTLYTMDNVTGCTMHDTTVVWDQLLTANIYPDTVVACNSQAYFDLLPTSYAPVSWEEYDLGWNLVNSNFGNPDYTVFNSGNPVYLVCTAQTSMGCLFSDTTLVDFSGQFNFSLGPDVVTMTTPYILSGPVGYPMYSWQPNNAFTTSIQVYSTGTFVLTINNGQGCVDSDTIVVTILPTVIGTKGDAAPVLIYPNPAGDFFTVSAHTSIQAVVLYDVQGMIVGTATGEGAQLTIETGNLAEGIYIVEILTEQGISRSRLVISR